jgi:Abnormal spindle-like microcephaly-assoc'd, ASPM-SPD-2-Hydin
VLRHFSLTRFVVAGGIRPLALSIAVSAFVVAGCGGGGGSASHLSASVSRVNFGSVDVGSTNSQLVTVTNESVTNVNVSAATSGTGFAVSGASNTALAPEQSVNLYVSFNPTAAGSASGLLSIASTASPTPLKITLSGAANTSPQQAVVLNWNPSSSSVVGYFIYRSTQGPSAYAKVNSSPNASTSFTDNTVNAGTTYYYAVTSVNSSNVESGYSNPVSVTVPAN